jgi:two-component system sensor histidine kinase RpfC
MDGEQRRMAKTISESGQSLLHLINTLLDFSRAESGRMPEKLEAFNLFALVGRVYRVSKVQSAKKGLNLSVHGDPKLGSSYFGNMRFLEDCLINLLTNAIKFTEKGSVTLSISVIESEKNSQRLRFEVIDTGPGIPADAQQTIFESFSQQDESILDRFGGSGLGLALCREYVHSMGGQISLQSEVGKGSNFVIEVPLQHRQIEREMMEPDSHFPMVLVTRDEELVTSLGSNYMVSHCHSSVEQGLRAVTKEAEIKGATPILLLDRAFINEASQQVEQRLAKHRTSGALELIWIGEEGEVPHKPLLGYASSALSWIDRRQPRYDLRKLAAFANHLHDSLDGEAITSTDQYSRSILVADDNKTNQMVIEKMLTSMGHDVCLVGDGQQVLDQLQDKHFDLVLMDINMPILNGLDAAKHYRDACNEKDLTGTPILALTADANLEMEQACRAVGMQGCLHKPIDRADLTKAIERHAIVTFGEAKQISETTEVSEAPIEAQIEITEEEVVEHVAPVCQTTVNDLVDLGGKNFVSELAEQFSHDAANALLKLSDAVNNADSATFRDEAHALRSASANIGAQMLFQTCLSWREIENGELESEGGQHLQRLQDEMQQAIEGLEQVLDVTLPKPDKLELKMAS